VGVAITDHNEIRGALRAWEKRGDVLVIPGIEVKAQSGIDILVYFQRPDALERYYKEVIEPKRERHPFFTRLSEEEVVEGAAGLGATIAAAHPFAPRLLGLGAVIQTGVVPVGILRDIPFVEGTNGSMSAERNHEAAAWAGKCGKKLIGGSDAHIPGHIGDTVTCVRCEQGEHFLEALMKKDTTLVSAPPPSFMSALVYVAGEAKVLLQPDGIRKFPRFLMMSLDRTPRLGSAKFPLPFPS
jgi:predicted metal-dependent phosphoesterase TrpH